MTIDNLIVSEEPLKSYVLRDKQGSASPYQHCNLCPTDDHLSCTSACWKQREEAEAKDKIKVTYP